MIYFQIGEDIIAAAARKSAGNCQPYLLAMGDNKHIDKFFVVLDRQVMDAGSEVIRAFDILFKVHFIFNVEFAVQHDNLYSFFHTFLIILKKKMYVHL